VYRWAGSGLTAARKEAGCTRQRQYQARISEIFDLQCLKLRSRNLDGSQACAIVWGDTYDQDCDESTSTGVLILVFICCRSTRVEDIEYAIRAYLLIHDYR